MLKPNLRNKRVRKTKGFTLIELAVVVACIALLASKIVPMITDSRMDSKVGELKSDLISISKAVQKVYFDDGVYPTTVPWEDIEHQLPSNVDETNPWGEDYVITAGGINYGSGCSYTARTGDDTLFNIEAELPANSERTSLRITDDYDDCTAVASGDSVLFEFQ